MMTYQLLGAVAIVVGLVGTWFAARSRRGWLLCIASTVLWLPALTTGGQWTAVGNCALSIGICLRNFLVHPARTRRTSTSRRPSRGSDQDGSLLHEGMAAQNQAPGSPANAADATAFPYRDGGWAGVIVGVDPDPANAGLITRWAQDYWRDLHPNAAGGGYVNFLMDEGQDRVRDSYRGNYDRLARIKGRYDPDNTFRINQNIQPAR